MGKHNYLQKVGGVYFAVIPVPKKLQTSLKHKQIWRSLQANCYGDAVINLNREVTRIMSYFELLKKHEDVIMLEEQHFQAIAEKCKSEILIQDQERRVKYFDNDESLGLLEWQKERDLKQLTIYKNSLSTGNYKKVINIVEEKLASEGIFWQRKSFIFKNLCMDVLKKLIQGYEIIIHRHENNWENNYTPVQTIPLLPYTPNTNNNNLLEIIEKLTRKLEKTEEQPVKQKSFTIDNLVENYNKSPEISQKSKEVLVKYSMYQRLLLHCIGNDFEIRNITRSYFRDLLSTLKQVPKNYCKFEDLNGLSIPQIIEKSKGNPKYEKLSSSSINDYLEHLQALLKWAKREGYEVLDDFSDIRAKREGKSRYDRLPFSMDQVKQIIQSPEIQKSKNNITRAELYWCVVLGFLTGMRIGEICQLQLRDIKKSNDIDYISVNLDEYKSVKTEQSVRDIPINDTLKKAGFLEYIESTRKKHPEDKSIFPYYNRGITRSGDPTSKRFSRLLKRLKIKNKKLTFHSTRHNYRDFVRESDLNQVEYNIALELCGWATDGSSVHSNYGSGHSLKRKLEVVNKIKYDGLEDVIL